MCIFSYYLHYEEAPTQINKHIDTLAKSDQPKEGINSALQKTGKKFN